MAARPEASTPDGISTEPRLSSASRSSALRSSSRSLAAASLVSIVFFSAASWSCFFWISAARCVVAFWRMLSALASVVKESKSCACSVVVGRHRREVRDEGVGVVGVGDHADRGEALAFVLADDRVLEVLAGRLELGVLAILVGLERDHVAAQLGQLELGVVQPLGGLLGLVEEGVDARLHVVDVGLCLGRLRGNEPDQCRRLRRGPATTAAVASRFRPWNTRRRSPWMSYAYRVS